MAAFIKSDEEYRKAKKNLLEVLKKINEGGQKDHIEFFLRSYYWVSNARSKINVNLFREYFGFNGDTPKSLLQIGLKYNFDASVISRRIDRVIDFILRYDIILEDERELLFSIFGETFERIPYNYRFLEIRDKPTRFIKRFPSAISVG